MNLTYPDYGSASIKALNLFLNAKHKHDTEMNVYHQNADEEYRALIEAIERYWKGKVKTENIYFPSYLWADSEGKTQGIPTGEIIFTVHIHRDADNKPIEGYTV